METQPTSNASEQSEVKSASAHESSAAPAAAPQVVQSVPSGAAPAFGAEDVKDHKLVAALSYLGILVLIPLFLARKSPFAQEHAKQGLILLIVHIVGIFVYWIPLIGQLIWLVVVIANIVALVKCLMGEFWEIPLIGEYRKKIHLEKL